MILRNSIRWGLILGLSVVISTQVLTWMGYGLTNWFVGLTYLCVVICTWLGCRGIGLLKGREMTWKEAVVFLLAMIIIGRYIFQVYMFVYVFYIEPDWIEKVTEIWTDMMKDQGLTSEVIQQRIAFFHRAYLPWRMFSIEIFAIGLPQLALSLLVFGLRRWLKHRTLKQ